MESYGDLGQLSPVGESFIPISNRMLRRLKKASSISELCSGSEILGGGKPDGEDVGTLGMESVPTLNRFDEEDEQRYGFEGLGVDGDGVGAKKALDFDSINVELAEKSEDGDEGSRIGEEIRDLEMKEAGKKRVVSDDTEGYEDESNKEKSKKKKSIGFDELPISSVSINMSKKERREYVDQLRAESQRLLRETRDAAFEPIPLVQKPISCILEKIRQRKQEISKKFLSKRESCSIEKSDGVTQEAIKDDEYEVVIEERGDDITLKMPSERIIERKNILENSSTPGLSNSHSHSSNETENNPGLKDLSPHSLTTESMDKIREKTSTNPFEEEMAPSALAMNLKLNQSPVCEESSEEENEKENVDPHAHSSSPDGDPVRAFIDEEAEEEDDSDNDLLRFKDGEEDGDEEDDDLRDMIVSQFKEDPNDKERCNELHQEWLRQEDAAGTEKLMQKLKNGLQQNEASLLEDEAKTDDEEREAKSDDEDEDNPCQAKSARMTMKQIKEMIPLMFTDKDDIYVSSDDEEMEEKLLKHQLCSKKDQKAKFSSPARDESSREIFCRIKKVNNIPEKGKKPKTSSFPNKWLTGGNRNATSSKSSFLGRDPKNALSAASNKRGSGVVRGFIFERDDSSSRSLNPAPEESSETIQQKNRQTRAPAKFSSSQSQIRSTTSQDTAMADETGSRSPSCSRTPLYEILKRSSLQSSCISGQTITSSHTESIFAAFKLDKRPPAKASPMNGLFQ